MRQKQLGTLRRASFMFCSVSDLFNCRRVTPLHCSLLANCLRPPHKFSCANLFTVRFRRSWCVEARTTSPTTCRPFIGTCPACRARKLASSTYAKSPCRRHRTTCTSTDCVEASMTPCRATRGLPYVPRDSKYTRYVIKTWKLSSEFSRFFFIDCVDCDEMWNGKNQHWRYDPFVWNWLELLVLLQLYRGNPSLARLFLHLDGGHHWQNKSFFMSSFFHLFSC